MKKETNQMLQDKISRLITENGNYQMEVTKLTKEKESIMVNHVTQARDDAQKLAALKVNKDHEIIELQTKLIKCQEQIHIIKNESKNELDVFKNTMIEEKTDLTNKLKNAELIIKSLQQSMADTITNLTGFYQYREYL